MRGSAITEQKIQRSEAIAILMTAMRLARMEDIPAYN